jgi:CO/xanthine dehydrogenase Mo-binding subunit
MKIRNSSQLINQRTMTPDALAALEKAGFSRRSFLKGAGAMIVSFSVAGVADKLLGTGSAAAQVVNNAQLDSWVAIAADGSVTGYVGKVELGQGIRTVQTQLVAEYLEVAVNRVNLIQGDTDISPNQGVTAGSNSHPTNFNPGNGSLMSAVATARAALLDLAAKRFNVPVGNLVFSDGVISVPGDSSKRATIGELIGGKKFNLTVNVNAPLKDPRTWKVLGTPVGRLETPEVVTGRFEYAGTVRVPGMVHGRVVRPPFVGGTVGSIDNQAQVESMPGNVKVVRRNDFIGVVADTQWAAQKAVEALKVTWKKPETPLPKQSEFYDWMLKQPNNRSLTVDSGDVDAKLAEAKAAGRYVEARYYHPYQMHASMGASVALADVRSDRATVWCASQNVTVHRGVVARLTGLPETSVRVVFKTGTGCYGINGADTIGFDAAILSHAVGKPVRVQLTRDDEMRWENYGPAYVIDQRVGLDAAGNIFVWDHESWTSTRGGRPAVNNPGNVITGHLAGFPTPRLNINNNPPTRPNNFGNGSNHVPSYMTGNAVNSGPGPLGYRYLGLIRSERVLVHTIASPFYTGPLRSPARLQNTWTHESFIDEVAAKVGRDPVEYRLRHLNDVSPQEEISGTRLKEVIIAAARAANWQTRPSPKPGNPRTGVVTGRGIAACLYEGDNGYCAVIAEVEVNQDTGEVTCLRFVNSHDCGPISNPDGVQNQMQGGIYQGMSRALAEEVTWNDYEITSIDWLTYPVLTFGRRTPEIKNVLINRHDVDAMGAGETTITCVAAAIGNAIFDATGARIRQLPLTPARVLAALQARP